MTTILATTIMAMFDTQEWRKTMQGDDDDD